MKRLSTLPALMLPALASAAVATAPAPGDLAFVNVDSQWESFLLATFVDLPEGSQFFITDNEWNGQPVGAGGGFTSGEGLLSWTLTEGISAGSAVYFGDLSVADAFATSGLLLRSGRFNIAQSNESLTLYMDVGGNPVPLAAIGYGSGFAAELVGSGLEAKAQALAGEVEYATYVGPRTGATHMDDYRVSLADQANWAVFAPGERPDIGVDLDGFEVAAPVPEPESYAMLLAGLGLVSVVARRRARA
jgi:hypothetical protein